jgi:glycosyltransferase involved in cell wall biosynthesis
MTRPIRVAMVHYRDDAIAGGSLRVGETIANKLDPERVAAEFVFAYGEPGPVTERTNLPCHFIRARGPKDFAAWARARDLFSRLRPDIIHFQEGVVWLRTALAKTPAKKVVHIHGRYSSFHSPDQTTRQKIRVALDARLSRTYLKSMDAQICINHATRDWLLDLGWIAKEKSCVVYNAIDVQRFASRMPQDNARDRLGLPRDALLLGLVCRLVWEKGCSDFLSIIERLPDRWHGVICGDGPQRDQLQRECEQRGLANRIYFLGSLDDVTPVYEAIDAYAFVSRYDAFGLTVAEAMAAGVPVFGIEHEGDYNEPEYPLIRPDTAAMVKCDGERDIEEAIQEIARRIADFGERPLTRIDSIERARAWVENSFAASIQAEAMTRVYQDIFGKGRPSQDALAQFYLAQRDAAERIIHGLDARQVVAATA